MASNIVTFGFIFTLSLMSYFYLNSTISDIVGQKELKLWYTSWLTLTGLAFILPSIAMLLALGLAFIFVIRKRVENKLALFVILSLVIPNGHQFKTPIFIFALSHMAIFVLLVPYYLSQKLSHKKQISRNTNYVDACVLAYVLLIAALQFRGIFIDPDEGVVKTYAYCIKDGISLLLLYYIPYYVASKSINNMHEIKNVICAFVVISTLLAPIAMLEVATSNLLYSNLSNTLHTTYNSLFVTRGGLLRAAAALNHPLFLANLMGLGFLFFFYISKSINNKLMVLVGFGILLGGLIAPLSRGPWLSAVIGLLIIFLFNPKKIKFASYGIVALVLVFVLIQFSEHKDALTQFIPFVGKDVDSSNIDYRARLFKVSQGLIAEYPFFGINNPSGHKSMLSLVQGEGIVDLVNIYLWIVLTYGVVGLFLFASVLIVIGFNLVKSLIMIKDKSSDEYLCGKVLLSSLVFMIVLMASLGPNNNFFTIVFTHLGLCVSYIHIVRKKFSSLVKNDSVSYPTSRVVSSE